MDIGGRDEDVQYRPLSRIKGTRRGVDVTRRATRKGGHSGLLYRPSYIPHTLQVTRRCCRESCFDDVDAQPVKLLCQNDLFTGGHAGAGRLFAVAQGSVEDAYYIYLHGRSPLDRSTGQKSGESSGSIAIWATWRSSTGICSGLTKLHSYQAKLL